MALFKVICKFTAKITSRRSKVTTFQERMSVRCKNFTSKYINWISLCIVSYKRDTDLK